MSFTMASIRRSSEYGEKPSRLSEEHTEDGLGLLEEHDVEEPRISNSRATCRPQHILTWISSAIIVTLILASLAHISFEIVEHRDGTYARNQSRKLWDIEHCRGCSCYRMRLGSYELGLEPTRMLRCRTHRRLHESYRLELAHGSHVDGSVGRADCWDLQGISFEVVHLKDVPYCTLLSEYYSRLMF